MKQLYPINLTINLIKLIKICIQILEVFKTKKDDFIYNRYYLSTIYFLQFGSIHEERKEGAMHTQLSKIWNIPRMAAINTQS